MAAAMSSLILKTVRAFSLLAIPLFVFFGVLASRYSPNPLEVFLRVVALFYFVLLPVILLCIFWIEGRKEQR